MFHALRQILQRREWLASQDLRTGLRWAPVRVGVILACSVLLSPPFTHAQGAATTDNGSIVGSVADASGAAIPQATVTATNTKTGIVTQVKTGARGLFTLSALPFGDYVIGAEAENFGTASSKPFTLTVGATARVDLKLSIAAVSESIQVTGTMSTVNLSDATAGTTLNEDQIKNLPTNGRDVMDLLGLAPGSVNSTGGFQGSINGQENFATGLQVTLDGQNASRPDISGFSETEGAEASRMTRASIDGVQEIDFANGGYSAEVGHSLGPQMNIITKGGSNNFHGTVFEFFRNDALDAKDYFYNPVTQPNVPLRLNQFGGSLGGPLVKEKLFFFANYEGIRQKTTQINNLTSTPSAYVRSQFVAAMQPVLAQLAPLPAGCTSIPAPSSCAVPGYTDSNPAKGSDLVFIPTALPTTVSESTGAIRVDYSPTASDRLFARYTINDGVTRQTFGPNVGQTAPEALLNVYGILNETHTFSPTLVDEISVGIQKFHSDTNSETPQPLVGFSGFFTNLGSLPGPNTFNQVNNDTVFSISDNATKTLGRSTLRAGGAAQFVRLGVWARPQQTFLFGSFSDLEHDNPFVLTKIGFPKFVGVHDANWDVYAQQNWRLNDRVTVNLGLRADINTVWQSRDNLQQNFDVATQSFESPNSALYNGPLVDVSPRVGFSYDPYGKGKTAVHAYYGLFFLPLQFGAQFVENNPSYQSYSVNVFQTPLRYPMDNPALPAGTQNVSIMPHDAHDPYSVNWLFGVQQELMANTVLTVNYVANEDHRMTAGQNFAAVNLNSGNLVTQDNRRYSNFANEYLFANELSSAYHSLQVQLRHNTGNLNFEVNYTWSHTINDLVNFLGSYSDPLDPSKDLGNGDGDIRNNFSGSVTYNLPELKGSSLLRRLALGGWQTSSIVQTRSGEALNPTLTGGFFGLPSRPNFTGTPVRLARGSWPNGRYDVAAFQVPMGYNGVPGDPSTLGNVPRNSLPGPAFFQLDASAMKNLPLSEKVKLQLRADVFNIFNHPNFGNPSNMGICNAIALSSNGTTSSCSFGVNQQFSQVGQTLASQNNSLVGSGTARQIQLAAKIIF